MITRMEKSEMCQQSLHISPAVYERNATFVSNGCATIGRLSVLYAAMQQRWWNMSPTPCGLLRFHAGTLIWVALWCGRIKQVPKLTWDPAQCVGVLPLCMYCMLYICRYRIPIHWVGSCVNRICICTCLCIVLGLFPCITDDIKQKSYGIQSYVMEMFVRSAGRATCHGRAQEQQPIRNLYSRQS